MATEAARLPQTDLLASLNRNIASRTDSAVTNAGLLSVLLQGSKLPEIYVQPEEERPTIPLDKTEPEIDLPVVDMAAFDSTDNAVKDKALATIVGAFESWGFVQVINHGVDLKLIDSCSKQAHRLFELPVNVKQNALRVPGAFYGYGANFWLNLPAMNWAESFHVDNKSVREYAGKLWGSEHEEFSVAVEKYVSEVEQLGHRVRHVLTEGLGLPRTHFDNYFEEETMATLRMNFYPVCPEPSLALGLKAHRDPHFLTLLHQDETGGLQVWNPDHDEWFNVKPRKDAFIINCGDVLQACSNGKYRSALHRAVVNNHKTRLSMACFYNTGATVLAPAHLITPENPQRYRPFSWREYIRTAYTYTTGAVSMLDQLYALEQNLSDLQLGNRAPATSVLLPAD